MKKRINSKMNSKTLMPNMIGYSTRGGGLVVSSSYHGRVASRRPDVLDVQHQSLTRKKTVLRLSIFSWLHLAQRAILKRILEQLACLRWCVFSLLRTAKIKPKG
jgi:hypothetical protein